MVDEQLAACGIIVGHETVPLEFGRYRVPQAGDKWHVDEVLLTNPV